MPTVFITIKMNFNYYLTKKNIDITLISETHFTPLSHLTIPGYQVYLTCHSDGTAHAGTAIYIKKNLSHHPLTSYSETYLQATSLIINLENNTQLAISSIYCPSGPKITPENVETFFSSLGQQFIIGGDLNSKHPCWGNRSANTRGRVLNTVLTIKNYTTISPLGPIYWQSHRNRLDIFVTKIPNHLITNIINLNDLSSDHTPIFLEIGAKVKKLFRPFITPGRINWQKFSKLINKKIILQTTLKSIVEIDNAVHSLTTQIQEAPLAATINDSQLPNNTITPVHIKLLLAEKRRVRAQWQRS
jgi:hypothetical protein